MKLTVNDRPLFDSRILVFSCRGSLERMIKRKLDCLNWPWHVSATIRSFPSRTATAHGHVDIPL